MEGICPICGTSGEVGRPCPEKGCQAQGIHLVAREYMDGLSTGVLARDSFIGKKVDDYLLLKKLGEGGFGAVYLAYQLPIMMKTAVKVLRAVSGGIDAVERARSFEVEARALARLSHPNVVRLMKYGVLDDVPYVVTEFVKDGQELKSVLKSRATAGGSFSPAETRHIMGQLLNALESAHEDGLIHRNLKPANIMLQQVKGDALFVRVLDFGLAKCFEESGDTSVARGTPAYMAPEQITGRNIGPWTDLYAAGLILFELFTTRPAFAGTNSTDVLTRKLDPEHDPTAHAEGIICPESVRSFVRTAAATMPEARFQNVTAFRSAMERMFDSIGASGAPGTAQSPGAASGNAFTPGDEAQLATSDTEAAPLAATAVDRPVRPGPVKARRPGRLAWALRLAAAASLTTLLATGGLLLFDHFGNTAPDIPEDRTQPAPDGLSDSTAELAVNTTTALDQEMPSIAGCRDGSFAVAWQSDHQDGSGGGIFAQVFGPGGKRIGDEVRVNAYTSGLQVIPRVACLPDRGFVVVWLSEFQDGDGWGVFSRFLTHEGRAEGNEIRVNEYTAGNQETASVDVLFDGRFVVVWQSSQQDGDGHGVYGRLFDGSGAPAGKEFRVNPSPKGSQRFPSVAAFPTGRFAVAWESTLQDTAGYDVFVRVLAQEGSPLGDGIRVNETARGGQRWPFVRAVGDTGYVVLWTGEGQDGEGRGVFGRLLDPDGAGRSAEFQVNTTTAGNQWLPVGASFPDGRFVALWMTEGQDESGHAVIGRAYDAGGHPLSAEFRLNAFEKGDQRIRSASAVGSSHFAAVWESEGQDGDGWGLFARTGLLGADGTVQFDLPGAPASDAR